MRYLKRFIEDNSDNDAKNIETLKFEARQYLAHLLDGDWNINVSSAGSYRDRIFSRPYQYDLYNIFIEYVKEDRDGDGMMIQFSLVRDDILQYLDFMIRKYGVKDDFLVYYEYKGDDLFDSFTREQLEKKRMKISYIKLEVKIYL